MPTTPSVSAHHGQIIPFSKAVHPSKTPQLVTLQRNTLSEHPTSLGWLLTLSSHVLPYYTSPSRPCHIPDGQWGVPSIPPVLGGADVHAPQLPAVSMGWVLITLHLKVVLLDVVYGGKDDSSSVFLNSWKHWLSPGKKKQCAGRNLISPHVCTWTLLPSYSLYA